jgi:hypothetical protein
MHRAAQLVRQRGMDAALTLNARGAFKRRRHQTDMEMGLSRAAIVARGAGMAGMGGAFVADFERYGRESSGQFVPDGVGYAHAGRVRVSQAKVKNFIFLFFTPAIP